jgi:hypothetical protein
MKMNIGEWFNVGMWLDLDLGQIYYIFNNEFVAETSANTKDLTDFAGILFSKQGDTGAYIDNIKVVKIDRTYFDELSQKGVAIPEKLMEKATVRADIGEIGNAVYEKNKEILVRGLRDLGFFCVEPQGTFYMFPRTLIPDDIAFCEKAKDFNLLIVPGTGFGCPGHARISYCVPTERAERSLEAFAKLAAAYR